MPDFSTYDIIERKCKDLVRENNELIWALSVATAEAPPLDLVASKAGLTRTNTQLFVKVCRDARTKLEALYAARNPAPTTRRRIKAA